MSKFQNNFKNDDTNINNEEQFLEQSEDFSQDGTFLDDQSLNDTFENQTDDTFLDNITSSDKDDAIIELDMNEISEIVDECIEENLLDLPITEDELSGDMDEAIIEEASNTNYDVMDDGNLFYGIGYNDYNAVNNMLIDRQGEAYSDFQGTCGLCSTANSLRLLGIEDVSEQDVIDTAANYFPPLCCVGDDPYSNGGTNNSNIVDIFSLYGCEAQQRPDLSLEDIDSAINSGNAMMMSVKAEYIVGENPNYVDPYTAQTDHWVTVVGMKKDEAGNITGVMIKDTGGWADEPIIEMSVDKFNWMRENFDDFTGIEASRRV